MEEFFSDNNIYDRFLGDDFTSNSFDMKYDVDVVFVVDATGSMGALLSTVKDMIPKFYKMVEKALNEKNKRVDNLRVKVIFFRDFFEYESDNCAPLMQTAFYTLSGDGNDQSAELSRQIASITDCGGGDIPEDGLEALAAAMKSDWCQKKSGHKRRHIIVVFSDAPTHPIGYAVTGGRRCSIYPTGMPSNFNELTELWGNKFNREGSMDYFSKRLILFIPELSRLEKVQGDGWTQIVKGATPWENCDVVEIPIEANNPNYKFNVDFSRIIDRISNSI